LDSDDRSLVGKARCTITGGTQKLEKLVETDRREIAAVVVKIKKKVPGVWEGSFLKAPFKRCQPF